MLHVAQFVTPVAHVGQVEAVLSMKPALHWVHTVELEHTAQLAIAEVHVVQVVAEAK